LSFKDLVNAVDRVLGEVNREQSLDADLPFSLSILNVLSNGFLND